MRDPDIWIHEAQRTPNRLNLKRATERCVIIKLSKVKDKEGAWVAQWEEHVTLETVQATRQRDDLVKMLKDYDTQQG